MSDEPRRRRTARDPARRTARGLLHIGTTLPYAAGPALHVRGTIYPRLRTEWRTIAGDFIADGTQPERVVFPRGRRQPGILHIRVAPGGFALDVQHYAPQLIERINAYFGREAVAEIRIRQGPVTPPEPPVREPPPVRRTALPADREEELDRRLEGIEHDELREALRRLGRSVGRRRTGGTD